MCDDQSPSSWRISSAKSVSIACTPPAASASLSPISSVVSDLTFTTSVTPCARAISRTMRVRLRRVARPVHLAAGRGDRLLELDQVLVEMGEHVGLDRAARPRAAPPSRAPRRRPGRACRGSSSSRCAGSRGAAGRRAPRARPPETAGAPRSPCARARRGSPRGAACARRARSRESRPPICSRHEPSTAVQTSAPVETIARHLSIDHRRSTCRRSSRRRCRRSRSTPSRPAARRARGPSTASSSRSGASPTRVTRSEWQVG